MNWLKSLFCILLGLSLITTSFASTDIYLDKEGWCPTLEIVFKAYNITDWNNRDLVDDDDDDSIYIRNITGTYTVYNGPIESTGILIDGNLNATGQFKATFPEQNDYLVIIDPVGNYTTYESFIEIDTCPFLGGSNETVEEEEEVINETVVNETEEPKLSNRSFKYLNGQFALNIKDTDTNVNDYTITEYNSGNLKAGVTPLDTLIRAFEVTPIGDKTYGEIGFSYDNAEVSTVEKLYKYNFNSNTWEELVLSKSGTVITASASGEGLFAIATAPPPEPEPEPVVEEVVETPVLEETNETQGNNSGLSLFSSEDGISAFQIAMIVLLLLILGGGGAYKFSKKKTDKKEYNLGKKEVVTKENEIIEKTKEYILKYKDEYKKDQIYRTLEKAKVPKEVVDKAMLEIYKD